MEKFTVVHGVAAAMLIGNINTDLISPELVPGRSPEENPLMPLRDKLFANLRYDAGGKPRPDFVLGMPRYAGCRILLAGPNFGCGSSRESAVWALMDFGIRCVIAPSFSDIFYDNAFQNGLLPVRLDIAKIGKISAALDGMELPEMTVDLERCEISARGLAAIRFEIPQERRGPLLEGLDQITFILRSSDNILSFENADERARPWIYRLSGT